MDASKKSVVLLVEDDVADQKLIKNSLASQKVPIELRIVGTGEEALRYLQHSKGADAQSPRPNLIMLDLNMPGMGGKEFLRRIKADDDLYTIPVVILTVSGAETDIQESYKLHAAGYIQKCANPEELKEIMSKTIKYWFEHSSLVKD